MTKNTPLHQAKAVTRSIRDGLQSLLLNAPEHAQPIGRVLKQLSTLEVHLDQIAGSRSGNKDHRPVPAEAVSHYDIEWSRSGEAIAEHRSTDAEPFRCPVPAFEATVIALHELKTAKFDQVAQKVTEVMGQEPPVYQIRTALRFLKCLGIVSHERARFTVKTPKTFRKEAAAGLKSLHSKRLDARHASPAIRGKSKVVEEAI